MKNITDDISTMYYIVVIVSTFQGERVTPMLHIPILKILSFDPGTTVTGWAMSTYTRSDRVLIVHKCGEITPIKYAKKSSKSECEKYGPQLIALQHLHDSVDSILVKEQPDVVVTEDAFLHPKFITAYAALTLCIHTICRAARLHGLHCDKIAPKLVKKLASEDGTSDKHSMLSSMLDNPHINILNSKYRDIAKLSQHVTDAISVGYAYTRQLNV